MQNLLHSRILLLELKNILLLYGESLIILNFNLLHATSCTSVDISNEKKFWFLSDSRIFGKFFTKFFMECLRCIKYVLFCVSFDLFLTSKILCLGHPFTSYYFECNNCQGSCFPANPWVWNIMHTLVLLHVLLCSTNLQRKLLSWNSLVCHVLHVLVLLHILLLQQTATLLPCTSLACLCKTKDE